MAQTHLGWIESKINNVIDLMVKNNPRLIARRANVPGNIYMVVPAVDTVIKSNDSAVDGG